MDFDHMIRRYFRTSQLLEVTPMDLSASLGQEQAAWPCS
jgi:hypothetical protein